MKTFSVLDLSPDESTLVLTARYVFPPDRVFAAWLDPEAMARWIRPSPDCRIEVQRFEPRLGGAFRVVMSMAEGDYGYSGTFTAIEPPRRLEMSWQWDQTTDEPYPETSVLVECEPDDEGTRLTLTHSRIRSLESRLAHAEGWTGSLTALSLYLENP
jgi:uncharacterized protein YndB with AHSA1/START domain